MVTDVSKDHSDVFSKACNCLIVNIQVLLYYRKVWVGVVVKALR
jgi:hypothetical protein